MKKDKRCTLNKTPLQKWAWERFRLKGGLTSTRAQLFGLLYLDNISDLETTTIVKITNLIDEALADWNRSHQLTRTDAEKGG